MNLGPVAHRYAKALLKYSQETSTGEKVYSQVDILVRIMMKYRQFADAIQKHPELPLDSKLAFIDSALGESMSDELKRFVTLVYEHKRMEYMERILYSFLEQYRSVNSIKVGHLITACKITGLKERLQEILGRGTGATVILEEDTDSAILGGFILNIDDLLMDASVEGQFRQLRKELIDNNNRIV